jgi:hypothetical protein
MIRKSVVFKVLVGNTGGGGKRDHLEDLKEDKRMVSNLIREKCDGEVVNWIHVAQDRDKRGDIVSKAEWSSI